MLRSGIDEAALGPLLGPYTAAMTRFSCSAPQELYDQLSPYISKEPAEQGLAVGDSKKIFNPKKGLYDLEKTLLSFLSLLGKTPVNLKQLWQDLNMDMSMIEKSPPFYALAEKMTLPLACPQEVILERSRELKQVMENKEIKLLEIEALMIPVPHFNSLLKKYNNKAKVCQILLGPMVQRAVANEKKTNMLWVDRQGGRRFYGEWLLELFPRKPLMAIHELSQQSVYQWNDTKVGFQVKADGIYLETALASMTAKYCRETAMVLYNSYWQEKYPQLKGTAGYVQDGRRFIQDLKDLGEREENLKDLQRNK